MNHEEKVNILLVDDQPARLLSYETILEGLGQNLVQARSGPRGRREADERRVRRGACSMSACPAWMGSRTASLIHEHPRFEKTPIIFVTGVHVTELDRLKGYKLGAVDYVYIPVVPEILRSKVSVLVELHLQRRELQTLNRSLAEANRRLELANTNLQAEKTRELESLNLTLKRANTELEQTNRVLQGEVAERARAEGALKEAGSPQGRVPRGARARAAQSARADPQRRGDHASKRADRSAARLVARRDRATGQASHAAGR
ncbi:MAG: response regulator [Gammaproteobacteria bacterium]